jgi:hypothetical protein
MQDMSLFQSKQLDLDCIPHFKLSPEVELKP